MLKLLYSYEDGLVPDEWKTAVSEPVSTWWCRQKLALSFQEPNTGLSACTQPLRCLSHHVLFHNFTITWLQGTGRWNILH